VDADVGQKHRFRVAYYHCEDVPAPVDKYADLPLDLFGDFGEGARQLGADDPFRGSPAICQALEAAQGRRFQSVDIACDSDGWLLLR
jgi:hypothetical protein